MKTFPIKKKDGRLVAFEIDNTDIWPRKISKLLNTLEGVTEIQRKKLFQRLDTDHSDTVHVKFRYKNTEYFVWEPWGDSSRYWIGPRDINDMDMGITDIESVFQQYKLSLIPRLVIWIVFFPILLFLIFKAIAS